MTLIPAGPRKTSLSTSPLSRTQEPSKSSAPGGLGSVYSDKGLDIDEARTSREVQLETDENLHKLAEADPSSSYYIPLKEKVTSVIQRAAQNIQDGKPLETEDAFSLIEKMEESVTRNKDALILLIRIRQKDEYTLMHSISVGSLVLSFCNYAKIPP